VASAIAAHDAAQSQLAWAQKMEAVGQLTGGVAHDFNNLLTAIGGSLALLEPALPDGHLREISASAQRAVDRGAQLTASLLAFSRKQRLDPQPVDANAMLAEFDPLIRRAAGETVAVSFVVDSALRPCNADPAQLEAAILNLVINARDAMAPNGGTLTIATRNVTLTRGDLAENPEATAGAFVAIAVADTGPGMSPSVLSKAFEPFFTTKEVGKGSGLGLSQVYGFARQLGGHVAIESQPGRGTRVTVYLPAVAAPPETAAPARPSGAPRRLAGTVLVAEDDPEVREVARATLQAAGCRVLLAADGPEALAILDTEPGIDLLFSDVVMPNGVSGIELARTARRLRPGLKVLLTSGFITAALERHAADGAFTVLAKPYRHADLMRELTAVLGAANARAS
jgi:nitrogen-specific signal transduction histidine kinase/CheY-like chemotaxis protein